MKTIFLKSIRQKEGLLLLLAAFMLPFNDVRGQGYFNEKRHQFGFGVSTALFDDTDLFNLYRLPVENLNGYFLNTQESSFYALYLDYQFRFGAKWSLETRIKYKCRHTIQQLVFSHTDGTCGYIGSINTSYHDIAIPITMNYRWTAASGSGFELFFGAGVSTSGLSKDDDEQVYSFNDRHGATVEKELRFDRGYDVYGILGFQFVIPVGPCCLKPFVSLSYSPVANGRYFVTPIKGDLNRFKERHSRQMHLSELECGVMVQF